MRSDPSGPGSPSGRSAAPAGGAPANVVAEHGRLLFAIAYRMLGSVAEAEDAVGEAFLRYTQAEGQVDHPRAWLTTVVTRVCLDRLRSAQRRRETYVGPWLPEPLVVDEHDPADSAELVESLSLAFLVLLETLSPAERAVFLLHDVFSYSFDEIAGMVGRSAAACRQLASRARRRIEERRPRYEADARARDAAADAFLRAVSGGDMSALLRLLDPEVVLRSDGGGRVSAARRPVVGADAVARFLLGLVRKGHGRFTAERLVVNGTPGLLIRAEGDTDTVMALDVFADRVTAVHMVRNPAKLAHLRRG